MKGAANYCSPFKIDRIYMIDKMIKHSVNYVKSVYHLFHLSAGMRVLILSEP